MRADGKRKAREVVGPSRAVENSDRLELAEHSLNDITGQAKRRSFTSWKLDVVDALSVDPEVTDLDFRVAFRIIQHLNSVSRIAWPSVARLAAQLGKSEDRVRASTKRLQAVGWLVKERKSQKAPNEYRFLSARLDRVLNAMLDRVDAIGVEEDDHADLHGQNQDDHADLRGGDHADLPYGDHADLHGKHLQYNHLHITPSVPGTEVGKVTYTRERIPSDPDQFGPWVRATIPDQSKHREALRLLAGRQMTPEILKRMAA